MPASKANFERARALLGEGIWSVVESVPESRLQGQVLAAVEVCARSLEELDQLELTQFEGEDADDSERALWKALAPVIRSLTLGLDENARDLRQLFHADQIKPSEGEGALALEEAIDELDAGGAIDPLNTLTGLDIDRLVNALDEGAEAAIAKSVADLTSALEREFVRFRQLIRRPEVVSNHWGLLSEIVEFKNRCTQCFEAILATIVNALSEDELEKLLPRYQTAARRAAILRSAIVGLDEVVLFVAHGLQEPEPDTDVLWSTLKEALSDFQREPGHRWLRPSDRRLIVEFRIFLHNWKAHRGPVKLLIQEVDAFSKVLFLLRGVNRRPELIEHDRAHLDGALSALEGQSSPEPVFEMLRPVYGRSRTFDEILRNKDESRLQQQLVIELAELDAPGLDESPDI